MGDDFANAVNKKSKNDNKIKVFFKIIKKDGLINECIE
jgi:hypothetical protein